MGSYSRIFRVPRMPSLLATALFARLPIGINGLAIVLMLKAERGSFGIAGLTAGAFALANAVGVPVMARTVDRLGAWVLGVMALGCGAGLIGLIVSASDAPEAVVIGFAVLTGLCAPPVSSILRALYPRLLEGQPNLIHGAFALDSVLTELLFIAGPALTAGIAVLASPQAALGLSAVAVTLGTFAFLGALRGIDLGTGEARTAGLLGALGSPGVRTLVLTMLPVGFAFGILEISVTAFAADEGHPELAGVLLTLWACASASGGLVYGARPRRGSASDTHLRVALLLPIGLVPMLLATSPLTMAPLLIPAGIFIAPLLATRNELVGQVAPAGTETEAYTWPLTAIVAGIAGGQAIAGTIVDGAGWRTAAIVAIGSAVVGSVLSFSRRRTLQAPPPEAPLPAGVSGEPGLEQVGRGA